jgi:hypothetical protein
MVIKFEVSGSTPMTGEAAVGYHASPPPFQCLYCGRFAKFRGEYQAYDGQGTQCYASWSCTRCGDNEGVPMW